MAKANESAEPIKSVRLWEIGSIMRDLGDAAAELESQIEDLRELSKAWEAETRKERAAYDKEGKDYQPGPDPYADAIKTLEQEAHAGILAAFDATQEAFSIKLNAIGLMRQESQTAQELYLQQRSAFERRARIEGNRQSRFDNIVRYALHSLAQAGEEPPAIRDAPNFKKIGMENTAAKAPLLFPNPENPCEGLPDGLITKTIKVSGEIPYGEYILAVLMDAGLKIEISARPSDHVRVLVEQKITCETLLRNPALSEEQRKDTESKMDVAHRLLNKVNIRMGERPQRVAWRQ